jgi:NAD(P)-dependent dehydrogenase (short-subunit alcohol dehydrogenase family)
MKDVIVTGASRGIGRALALALAERGTRLVLVARDEARLRELEREVVRRGGQAAVVAGDQGSLASARRLGERLAAVAEPGSTLVQNAGVWPGRRTLTEEGLESAFVVNHLGPLLVQRRLLEAGRLRRVMVVSAGLIAKGSFDVARTPTGDDFSRLKTYANTKLCFAMATLDEAAAHPEVDFLALHPGVVRTDLGASSGLLGALLAWVKRSWEAPEVCAARLAGLLGREERWSPPGEVRWYFEEQERPWPATARDEAARRSLREVTARLVGG